ncbi:MAG: hypothetical protein AAF799_41870 [Myxococcota bacterium]
MSEPLRASASPHPSDDAISVSGEIVREQTVRAPIPTAPTNETVRAPMPAPPPSDAWDEADADEQPMVPRSWIPTPVDPLIASRRAEEKARAQAEALKKKAEAKQREAELAAAVPGRRRRTPTSRYDESSDVGRDDPAPVCGEVAVSVSPDDSATELVPPRARVQTLRSGEVPILSASPPALSNPTTDPGQQVYGYADITGPQPLAQAEVTGPIGVSARPVAARSSSSTTLLWLIAGVLVLLAGGVVALALTL